MADDIFDKLDTLLNRHRPSNPPLQDALEEIPTLTEEIPFDALETLPLPVLVDEVSDPNAFTANETPSANDDVPSLASASPIPPLEQTSVLSDHPLEQFILETVERRIAPKLASKLDLALGELLEQFKGEIDALVKQAIAQEMQQYLESFEQDLSRHKPSDSSR